MTITERVQELDRLYRAWDAARVAELSTPPREWKKARRRTRYCWGKYKALRDSRRGLPREKVRA